MPFGSRPPSFSLERSDSERRASSPMILARGSSVATFFPLRWEEPSSFASNMRDYLNGEDGY